MDRQQIIEAIKAMNVLELSQLVKDLETLKARVGTASITATSMANGAKELLDEVATSKVTGEEETYSHTDLVDFKANVDGAQKVYELLKPVVAQRDAALAAALDDEFAKVDRLLARYARGDGYVSYDTVGEQDRRRTREPLLQPWKPTRSRAPP